jgi:hypothetical protein
MTKTIDEKLNELLGFVDLKNVVTYDKQTGVVFVGGEHLDEAQILNLKSEAEYILQTGIWKILNETIRHVAHETMFTKSQTFEDMRSGRMMLYNLNTIKDLLAVFKGCQQKKINVASRKSMV